MSIGGNIIVIYDHCKNVFKKRGGGGGNTVTNKCKILNLIFSSSSLKIAVFFFNYFESIMLGSSGLGIAELVFLPPILSAGSDGACFLNTRCRPFVFVLL